MRAPAFKRPLAAALIYFIYGIITGHLASDNFNIVLFFVLALLSCAALYVFYKRGWVFIFVLFTALGQINISRHAEDGGMAGMISTHALTAADNGSYFVAETVPEKIKIIVYNTASGSRGPETGDTVFISGELLPTEPAVNPGGFDERMYYAARGIKYKMFSASVTVTGKGTGPAAVIARFRESFCRVYDEVLPEKEAGIIKSVIAGDRTGLSDSIRSLYSQGGIYHILAISGLHIGIAALFLNFLLRRILPVRAAHLAVLAFLIVYCVFTGASPSTVRAVIIYGVIIAGELLFRKSDPVTSLSFAAGCVLVYNPFYLWDLGFALSFSAAAGILLLSRPADAAFGLIALKLPPLRKFFENPWVKPGLSVSICVSLAALPVGTSYLPYISTYSVPVNIILFPTFFVLVCAGFITGLAGMISRGAALFFSGGLYYMLRLYETVLEFFAGLPASGIFTGYIPPYIAVPYYVFIAALSYYLIKTPKYLKPARRFVFVTFAVLAVSVCLRVMPLPYLETAMLDVGQGDCFVIRKGGDTVVIDGGGSRTAVPGRNTGSTVLMPYLDYIGVKSADLAVITHLDTDHAAGIAELINAGRTRAVALPAHTDKTAPLYKEIISLAEDRGIRVIHMARGDEIKNRDTVITCLNPGDGETRGNDNSIVLKLEYGDVSFLFTGDITEDTEKVLAESGLDLRADILKLAHHGSKYSNSERFLDAVSPKLAIVSYSKYNNYGFVSPEVRNGLYKRNIPLLETAEHGAVILVSNGERLTVKKFSG